MRREKISCVDMNMNYIMIYLFFECFDFAIEIIIVYTYSSYVQLSDHKINGVDAM
jgi:hypothetical protein